MGGNNWLPPENDEFELSLFGPGFGESIIIHTGNNNWIIIDSCCHHTLNEPIPLHYLRKININPADAIKLVIASHWHDDHIKNISKIMAVCENAEFCCSDALRSAEFRTFIYAFGESGIDNSGVEELYKIMMILKNRKTNRTPKFAIANRILFNRSKDNSGLNFPVSIYALSPSDAARLLSIKVIGTLLEEEVKLKIKRRIVDQKENNLAIALWISLGNYHFLLGSDLENLGNGEMGWQSILLDKNKPEGKALFFKIPHHGSITGYNCNVWNDLLDDNPIACLTPFHTGRHTIPKKEDIEKICSHTNQAFTTTKLYKSKRIDRNKAVERMIKEMGVKLHTTFSSLGQIRIRFKPALNQIPKVELLNGASELIEIYN